MLLLASSSARLPLFVVYGDDVFAFAPYLHWLCKDIFVLGCFLLSCFFYNVIKIQTFYSFNLLLSRAMNPVLDKTWSCLGFSCKISICFTRQHFWQSLTKEFNISVPKVQYQRIRLLRRTAFKTEEAFCLVSSSQTSTQPRCCCCSGHLK